MNPKGGASRGELTKAMGATIQTVRKHEMQIAAILEGIKQLMDGQAALGEAFDALKLESSETNQRIDNMYRQIGATEQLVVPMTWPR